MVLLLTFTVVVNDYNEAKAVTGVEETFLISALLSFIASTAITKSGIVPDAVEILSDFIESEIDVSDFHIMLKDLINKVNSGIPVSDSEMELYNEWVNGVQEFYLDFIRDMNNTGAIDEDSALAYITKLFDYDYVSEKDVREAFNMYCTMSNAVQTSKEAVKFGISNNVIACNKEFANCLSNEMSNAINLYMQKRQQALERGEAVEYKGTAKYSTTFNLSSGIVFPVGSDGDIKIREIINSGAPYIIVKDSYGGDNSLVIFSNYSRTDNILYASSESSRNWCFLLGSGLSKRSPYGGEFRYDLSGNFLNDSATDRMLGTLYQRELFYIYYYGNGFNFDDNILNLWGSPVLPASSDYPIDDTQVPPVVAPLPIDDLYNGSENRGQDIDTDIDSDVPIYSIDTSINDLADEIANLRVTIDNLDTDVPYDDYVKAVNDAVQKAHEKTDSKVDAAVKENIAVELGNANWNINDFTTSGLGSKFPFCIPYDLINLISVFNAEPVAPKFEIPFVFEKWGINESYTIDLSIFDNVAKIFRTFETFWFIGFLIMKTRGLIKG